VTPWYALSKDWQFGAVMCRLMPLSNSCSVFVSSWSLTAIALDKFIHILDPTRAPISLGQAGAVTLIIWLVCSVINLPAMLSYELVDGSHYVAPGQPPFCGHFCDETNWTSPASRQLYGAMVMLLQFVVPMGLISYCYARILGKVHSDMIIQNAQFSASLSSAQRHEAVQRKRRVNYILIAMVFTFVGCWTPLTAVNILKDFRLEPGFLAAQPYLWPLIAHSIAMSTTISNPFLFFWLTRKQKAPRIARALATNTSEVISSFASRVQSFKRNSMRSAHGDSSRRPGREKVDLLAIGGGE